MKEYYAELLQKALVIAKEKFLEHNDNVRPAVEAAKDRKAAVAKQQAQLKKDQKKYEKKLRAQRQKQAQKIYEERLKNGYEPTLARVNEDALKNLSLTKEEAKRAKAAEAKAAEAVEKEVAAKQAARNKEAEKVLADRGIVLAPDRDKAAEKAIAEKTEATKKAMAAKKADLAAREEEVRAFVSSNPEPAAPAAATVVPAAAAEVKAAVKSESNPGDYRPMTIMEKEATSAMDAKLDAIIEKEKVEREARRAREAAAVKAAEEKAVLEAEMEAVERKLDAVREAGAKELKIHEASEKEPKEYLS